MDNRCPMCDQIPELCSCCKEALKAEIVKLKADIREWLFSAGLMRAEIHGAVRYQIREYQLDMLRDLIGEPRSTDAHAG